MKKIPTTYNHVVAKTSDVNVVSVADIARDLHMDPKKVRARMRRIYKRADVRVRDLQTIAPGVWKYDVKHADAVRALIASFAHDDDSDDADGDTNA